MNKIETTLLDIGVPPHLTGFDYLTYGIDCVLQDPSLLHTATMLYRKVAREKNTTPNAVERCMRHAIKAAFQRANVEIIQKYFGNSISPSKGKPTNSEFIAAVTLVLREDGT